jgi:5'-nucleotidase/UDP-sugar diphosphatase
MAGKHNGEFALCLPAAMNLPPLPLRSLRRLSGRAATALGALLLASCAGVGPLEADAPPRPFELNIAHINDHHSQLDAFAGTELTLDGVATQVELGGFARQTAVFKALAGTPNLLKLHAGDAITGSLYYTFFKGKADAQMMNSICFDAFVPGNHEFDDGDGTSSRASWMNWPTRPTWQLQDAHRVGQHRAAGRLAAGPGGAAPTCSPTPSSDRRRGVGIVGVTIAAKTANSSRPLATTQFQDEAKAAQKAIDELKAKGVRHIVLMSHLGYDNDKRSPRN